MRTPVPLTFPGDFHYKHTLYSHGWCALFPFALDPARNELRRIVTIPGDRVAEVFCPPDGVRGVAISLEHGFRLRSRDMDEVRRLLTAMFRLDQDLSPFFRRISRDPLFGWMAKARAGRMLRCPTFFEDVIKMVLTTNCTWSLTEQMTTRLVRRFGARYTEELRAFPDAAAIASSNEVELRTEVKLGYRAPYVLALSRRVASGALDIEAFRTSSAPAKDLYKELLGLEGVGPYAAGNLLKLLGRFDYLGLDSWCRSAFSKLHGSNGAVSDTDIEQFYAPWEEWKGLVMWLDVTRHWYTEKFPFLNES